MKRHTLSADRVVDLLRFKSEQQRRLDFDGEPAPRPALAPVTPFRPLTPQQLDHRQRMLRHLAECRTRTLN
jgi:hypothetical protein